MSLESELRECIEHDSVSSLEAILQTNDIDIITPKIIDIFHFIAVWGSAAVFERVLKITKVAQYLAQNVERRRSFVRTAFRCSGWPLVSKLLEMPQFRDMVIEEPYDMLMLLAINRECSPQFLAKMQEFLNVHDYISLNNNSVLCKALGNYNYSAANCFLEFPSVYSSAEAADPEGHNGPRYINTYFMEYYFDKFNNQDLTEQQIELAVMILCTLYSTYSQRKEIRKRVKSNAQWDEKSRRSNTFFYKAIKEVRRLRDKYLPDNTDIHDQRIQMLLAVPAIKAKASEFFNFAEDPAEHKTTKSRSRCKAILGL